MDAPSQKCAFEFFYSKQDPFSNFYPAKLEYQPPGFKTMTYNCSEQAYQHSKSIHFKDYSTADKIMIALTPSEQKKLGRMVKNFDHTEWDEVSEMVMESILTAKFTQNPKLKETLLATGSKELVEASPYDTKWGIGLSKNSPHLHNKSFWLGRNLLGQILMRVRDKILAC